MQSEGVKLELERHFQSFSQAERDFVSVAFLEELPLGEISLSSEQSKKISTVIEVLRGIDPLEGIEWALEELALSSEGSIPALVAEVRLPFQEEV